MNEVKRTHVIAISALFVSVAVAGLILVVSSSFPVPQYSQLYGWGLFIVGVGFFLNTFIRYARRKKN